MPYCTSNSMVLASILTTWTEYDDVELKECHMLPTLLDCTPDSFEGILKKF